MYYVSYRPAPPLNKFIDYLWLMQDGQTRRLEKILPTGTIELVINLKHNEIDIHDPEQPHLYQRFSGAVLSGTYSRSFTCNAWQHHSIIGVHFKPGGAAPFLQIPASELTDTHASLADLWGRSADLELRERLYNASSPRQRFRVMENVLTGRLLDNTTRQPEVIGALKMFAKDVQVRTVSRELGLSQRRFIELFKSHVGLTPKLFCRIVRFQKARFLADKFKVPDWAQLALTCGYFDQSHLINDFKKFSGSTPKGYSILQAQKDTRLKENHVLYA